MNDTGAFCNNSWRMMKAGETVINQVALVFRM